MKIHQIRVRDFRSYKGEQSFDFSVSPGSSVSMLFGMNGSGKTTLLNAFTWALYGEMSSDQEKQGELANRTTWDNTPFGDQVSVEVEVTLEHGGVTYVARRVADVEKSGDRQTPRMHGLQLWEITADGRSVEVGAPQQKIEMMLPKELSRFFFFNGERIEKLVGAEAYSQIKQDVKTLLGLEVIERSLADLIKVKRKLGSELKTDADDATRSIQENIERRELQLEAVERDLRSLDEDRALLQEERASVLQVLREHAGVAPLQALRDQTHKQLESLRANQSALATQRIQRVTKQGFLAFTSAPLDTSLAVANQLGEKGELPAPLKRDFVDSLIERGECICGTSLELHSSAASRVVEWRKRAGLAEVEQAWQMLRGQAAGISESTRTLREDLIDLGVRLEANRAEVAKLEEQLTELNAQIGQLPLEDVRELEAKNAQLGQRLSRADQDYGNKRRLLDMGKSNLEKLQSQLERAELQSQQANRSRARLTLVTEVIEALEQIRSIRTDTMRRRLDAKIRRVFQAISLKPQDPELTEDFELVLYQTVGGRRTEAIKSTGENQILGLSFVAAVSQLAREVAEERRIYGETDSRDDGAYPVVIDAAFGSLDDNYQRSVANLLAEVAPQVILFVSKSQGLGVVLDELQDRLGSLGVIETHSTKEEARPEMIELLGREWKYFSPSQEGDWAEFQRVPL